MSSALVSERAKSAEGDAEMRRTFPRRPGVVLPTRELVREWIGESRALLIMEFVRE